MSELQVIQWSVQGQGIPQAFPLAIGPDVVGNERGVQVEFRPEVPGIWVSRLTLWKPVGSGDVYGGSKIYSCSVIYPGRPPIIIGYTGLRSSQQSLMGGGLGLGGYDGEFRSNQRQQQ